MRKQVSLKWLKKCPLQQKKFQKGVIVAAKIVENKDKIDEAIRKKGKHEKYRWISEQEVETFDEPAINDFKNTLKKVFSMWDEIFKEK